MAVLLLASLAAVASAKSFLDARVSTSSVERALLSELSGLADATQLAKINEELGPMYASLPKNRYGRLDPMPVRYALHRYFMQKHGWYVNGLGFANSTSNASGNASTSTTILKDRAPRFIQEICEQRLHGQGLNQQDLAAFAATLADLIHNEVSGNLVQVYSALGSPTTGPVTEPEYDMATKAYLIAYMSGGDQTVGSLEEFPDVESAWAYDYPAWNDTLMWVSDLKHTSDLSSNLRLSPFVERTRTFEQQVSFLQEFGHKYGTFQNLECHRLKDKLADMEDEGTGRVPLSRFYRGIRHGDWTFTESVAYLRHIGALDDTNPERMSVVIPNYIQSQSNCLAGSSFYSICCYDECESLLGHVEREVREPSASPSQIAAIVSSLSSDTVHAPRNLSRALLDRLGDIAQMHEGRVPLHGRLFAQWLHHAYPRECPFPHVTGVTSRTSPDQWLDANLDVDSAQATEEEMEAFLKFEAQDAMTPEAKAKALPWTTQEELVAGPCPGHLNVRSDAPTSSWGSLKFFVSAVATVSLITAVAKHTSRWLSQQKDDSKGIKFLV